MIALEARKDFGKVPDGAQRAQASAHIRQVVEQRLGIIPVRFSGRLGRALLDALTQIGQVDCVPAMGLTEDLQQHVVQTLGQFTRVRATNGIRTAFLGVPGYAYFYRHDAP